MMFGRIAIAGLLVVALPVSAAAPARRSIVMQKGQKLVQNAAFPLITITSPSSGAAPVVTWKFDQYGSGYILTAERAGESKVLLETTDSSIREVLNVTVTEKAVAALHQSIAARLSDMTGLSAEDVHPAGRGRVAVGGTVFSTDHLARCQALETKTTICGVALSPAAAVVHPEKGWTADASFTVEEKATPIRSDATEGLEGSSSWQALVLLGGIPVIRLESPQRVAVTERAVDLCASLNLLMKEWRAAASRGRVYPVMVSARRTPASTELTAQWKYDQGTRGAVLVRLTPEEIASAGGDPAVDWTANVLHDALRLHLLGQTPSRTGDSALKRLYENALRLSPPRLERESAGLAIARALYSMQLQGDDGIQKILSAASGTAH